LERNTGVQVMMFVMIDGWMTMRWCQRDRLTKNVEVHCRNMSWHFSLASWRAGSNVTLVCWSSCFTVSQSQPFSYTPK
jgi:hypothetical protein